MDIVFLQMVNASRQNLKARSPFIRLSRRVPSWVRYVHQVRILNLVLLILQIPFYLLFQWHTLKLLKFRSEEKLRAEIVC
jgi:hypothetical protein